MVPKASAKQPISGHIDAKTNASTTQNGYLGWPKPVHSGTHNRTETDSILHPTFIKRLIAFALIACALAGTARAQAPNHKLDSLEQVMLQGSDSGKVLGFLHRANWAGAQGRDWQTPWAIADSIAKNMDPYFSIVCQVSKTNIRSYSVHSNIAIEEYRASEQQLLAYLSSETIAYSFEAKQELGSVYYNIGRLLNASELAAAHTYLEKALALFEELQLPKKRAQVQVALSIYYMDVGKHAQALIMLLEAHEAMKVAKDDFWEAVVAMNISTTYLELKNLELALEYRQVGLDIMLRLEHLPGIARSYDGFAEIYQLGTRNFEKAIEYNLLAIETWEKMGAERSATLSHLNLGKCYLELNQPAKALQQLQVAQENSDSANYDLVAEIYLARARVYLLTGAVVDAQFAADSGMASVRKYNGIQLTAMAHEVYSEVLEANGRTPEALAALKHSQLFYDSLSSVENIASANKIAVEAQLRERELELHIAEQERQLVLEADIRKHQLQRNYLAGASFVLFIILLFSFLLYRNNRTRKISILERETVELQQQSLRARMNPHFIFNCLTSIQRLYLEGKTELANEYLSDFGHMVRRILRDTSRKAISVEDELECLEIYLHLEQLRHPDQISYELVIDPSIEQSGIFMPPLVIQPFVENAIWHGVLPKNKPGNITIQLQLAASEEALLCSITDDGVGHASTNSRAANGHESQGIALTEQRIGGNVQLSPRQGGGTIVNFEIPTEYPS